MIKRTLGSLRARALLIFLSSAALAVLPGPAAAQPAPKPGIDQEYVPPDVDPVKVDGLVWRLRLGLTSSFNDNRNVVGQPDGYALTVGSRFNAGVDYRSGKHEARSSFGFAASLARTPIVDEFAKSQDLVALEGLYLYRLAPVAGPFVRVAAQTSAFQGFDVRPEPTTFAIARADGTTDDVVAQRLVLTDPFRPLTLKQSLGVFLRPLESKRKNLETRAGLGARQTIADGQLAVADDAETPDLVEVLELQSFQQLGAELVLQFWGELADSRASYRFGAEAMVPFAHSALPAGDERSGFELMNVELFALLSFKLIDFASLDYEVRAVRQPQLLDAWQVQNNLMLKLAVALGDVEPEK